MSLFSHQKLEVGEDQHEIEVEDYLTRILKLVQEGRNEKGRVNDIDEFNVDEKRTFDEYMRLDDEPEEEVQLYLIKTHQVQERGEEDESEEEDPEDHKEEESLQVMSPAMQIQHLVEMKRERAKNEEGFMRNPMNRAPPRTIDIF